MKKDRKTHLAESIAALRSELDVEFVTLLGAELDELQKIAHFTESVQRKIQLHYADLFPKKCNSCGKVYLNRDDYVHATHDLANGNVRFDEIGLQEYRNCTCGSTLMLWTQDRRDLTQYGIARRALFDECLAKLKTLTQQSEADLRVRLREVFSFILG